MCGYRDGIPKALFTAGQRARKSGCRCGGVGRRVRMLERVWLGSVGVLGTGGSGGRVGDVGEAIGGVENMRLEEAAIQERE
jgi:hypothetical protein